MSPSELPAPTILAIGHGSRDREGADEFRRLAERLAERFESERPPVPCFLELADPSILGGIAECIATGAREIMAAPLMLFAANHVKTDIPAALAVARARYPAVSIRYGAPLGVQPEMLEVIDARIAAVEAAHPANERATTAVLVIERGSSDPSANADVFRLARLLWEGRGFGWVEPCFIGITRPGLEEGLTRCVALGASRVVVVPYFLFTGVLVRRIARVVDEHRTRWPGVELAVAAHLGAHPRLLDLAERRIREALGGHVCMSCDRCKYRVPLVGFEHQVGQPQTSDAAHGLREHGHLEHTHDGLAHGANTHRHGTREHGHDERSRAVHTEPPTRQSGT